MQNSWGFFFTSICQLSRTHSAMFLWKNARRVASSCCEDLSDYRLFVLASLVMKSWSRLGKEMLLAKTEHLHDPFPFTSWPTKMCSPVILLDLIVKQLEGKSELHGATLCWLGRPALPSAGFTHLLHMYYVFHLNGPSQGYFKLQMPVLIIYKWDSPHMDLTQFKDQHVLLHTGIFTVFFAL